MKKSIKVLSTMQINREVWIEGETKLVGENQAKELIKAGLAEENGETEATTVVEVPASTEPKKRETKPAKLPNLETK